MGGIRAVGGAEALSVLASPAEVVEVLAVDCWSKGSSGGIPIDAKSLREAGDAYALVLTSSVGLCDDTGIDWTIWEPCGSGLV